jgi:prepilin-type N-terminal cleavage/methylation domain-containing protein
MPYTSAVAERPDPLPRHTGSGSHGFSLAEMLIVLVIFGILAAMAAPRMSLSPAKLRAAASMAGSTLMAAQRAAIARQHNVVVSFDTAGRRLRVHYDLNNDGQIQTGEHNYWQPLPDGVVFGRAGAPAGRAGSAAISFRGREAGLPAAVFLRSGSMSEEGGFYLTTTLDRDRGNSGNVRMVTVERATGRPTWQRYEGGTWKTEF